MDKNVEGLLTLRDKIDHFRRLCENHNFYFEYYDNFVEWKKGRDSLDEIKRYGREIPWETANLIWGEVHQVRTGTAATPLFKDPES